jgi:hypothetical protein
VNFSYNFKAENNCKIDGYQNSFCLQGHDVLDSLAETIESSIASTMSDLRLKISNEIVYGQNVEIAREAVGIASQQLTNINTQIYDSIVSVVIQNQSVIKSVTRWTNLISVLIIAILCSIPMILCIVIFFIWWIFEIRRRNFSDYPSTSVRRGITSIMHAKFWYPRDDDRHQSCGASTSWCLTFLFTFTIITASRTE